QPLLAPDPARRLVASLCGVDTAVPAVVPPDLLLLPRGLLPVGVAVPYGVRRGRTAREIHWRDPISVDRPEHAPILLLHRRDYLGDQHLRRDRGIPISLGLRIRAGQHRSRGERDPAVDVHVVMPLLPTHRRRPPPALLQTPCALLVLVTGEPVEHQAQDVRVDHPWHADRDRPLHRASGQWHDPRSQIHWLRTVFVTLTANSEDLWLRSNGTHTTWS